MITRILDEGRYAVAAERLGRLGELDSAVQSAADGDDEAAVTTALSARVLPAADAGVTQVRVLLSDEDLIPGWW